MGYVSTPFSTTGRLRPPTFPIRQCLRKGCSRHFHPVRANQRYCQAPDCLREVRRWYAAKRQRKARCRSEVRGRHAAAEKARRQRRKAQAAAKPPNRGSAWSRRRKNSRNISHPICDRPGCFAAPRFSLRSPARYCSKHCRCAMRRVLDRERKWAARHGLRGRRHASRLTL